MSEVRPVLQSSEVYKESERAKTIIQYFEQFVSEEKELVSEIEWLIEGITSPGRMNIDLVASHNDF